MSSGQIDMSIPDAWTKGFVEQRMVLHDSLAHMECSVIARHAAGDHMIIIGEVHHAAAGDARPLLYYRGGYAQLER